MLLLSLFAGSLALLPLIALTSLLGARGGRAVGLPEPPGPAPRDLWTPIEAGLRHLSRSVSGREAKTLRRIYEEREFRPFWVESDSVSEAGRGLVGYLARPSRERLRSERRRLAEIGYLLDRAYPSPIERRVHAIAELEWALSRELFHQASRLLEGHRPSERSAAGWNIRDRSPDMSHVFARAEEIGVSETLRSLDRSHEPYTSLRRALGYYQSIQGAGGWEVIEEGTSLEPGDRSERVLALRRRLYASGDLQTPPGSLDFDSELQASVRRFQERHGLSPDGRAGRKTLAAMNVPVEERVRQLYINLERRRWLPERLGKEFVWVNIPEFRLRAFRSGGPVLDMPVVVGSPDTPTPIFEDEIEMAVLNPYWNVPESIAVGEIAPRAATDPSYLKRASFEILDSRGSLVLSEELRAADLQEGRYRIRRKPGPANDLGRIKFMFPNPYRVYLHDTPSRHLFGRETRAFSHGCIRVGRPLELARHLFPGRIDESDLDPGMEDEVERVVRLEKPVPIYIVYFTAWRSDDGAVHFRDDIYGHDEALWPALRDELAAETEDPAPGPFLAAAYE